MPPVDDKSSFDPGTLSSLEAAQTGVQLLLLAGTVCRLTHELPAEDQVAARQKRRETVVVGARLLSSAFDAPSVYNDERLEDIASAELAGEVLGWLSDGQRSGTLGDRAIANDQHLTRSWLTMALALLRQAARQTDERGKTAASTLIVSVIRPLCEALAAALSKDILQAETYVQLGNEVLPQEPSVQASLEEGLVSLAVEILAVASRCDPAVQEVAAALARLVMAGPLPADPGFVNMTTAISLALPRLIALADGPYLFAGEADVTNHLGVPVEVRGPAAFCRCGRSAIKPFCDGSHAAIGFRDDKDIHRVCDRRDDYVGQQATIYDNRGICAHSGFCTDRLKTVFHLGEETFITPSGGRLDDIMRAVRRCPSGALSVGLHQIEDRAYVDSPRHPAIEISRDGPYRITGGIALTDARGEMIPRAEGSSLEHYSLCRCGSSLNKPFCSGMHWSTKFVDPRPPAEWEPTLFEWAGGYPALLEMTQLFYSRYVPSDPVVGPLFARMEADHPERVAAWLTEVFGGSAFYTERYGGYTRMISQHLDKHLTQEQRSHWAMLMVRSADEAGLPNDPEFRAAFTAYIEWGSRIAVENSSSGARPPANMPVPRWWWVCNATPSSRVSANAPQIEDPAPDSPVLASGERPSFDKHIKNLFRPMDRNSMKSAFDLWAYEDVHKHADAILARVKAGTMPCDKAWAPEKVSIFERWTNEGRDA